MGVENLLEKFGGAVTMQFEFLKHFSKRMKHVGMYSMLLQNSAQKQTWKNYGLITTDEQLNVIFALLLYIMEQSLKEEKCTSDDIGNYLDILNTTYLHKNISYEDCRQLGNFIVNVVLSDEGKTMYFEGYDFEEQTYKTMHISYIANRVVYLDSDLKRTSYYLTDDGYNLLLSTLEIENNMKLTIHEMIFKMHLEKQSYDKAVDEIKNVFNLLRIQLQKIQEAMRKVQRNALNYSVADYKTILEENMETIDSTKQKFQTYRETVKKRALELEEQNINVSKLSQTDEEKLNHLKTIEYYLNRGLDEHQKILNSHFDLKILYDKELELLAQMSLIQRFSLKMELYDKVLQDASLLERIDIFLRPLFCQEPEKIYHLNKAMELQRPIRKKKIEENYEVIDFNENDWQEELLERQREKLKQYEGSLDFLLDVVIQKGTITLQEIKELAESEEKISVFIPTIDIFKEIMVELIKSREIDFEVLRKEKSEYIAEQTMEFQLHEMLLKLIEQKEQTSKFSKLFVWKLEDSPAVEFTDLCDEQGRKRTIRCSNVQILLK